MLRGLGFRVGSVTFAQLRRMCLSLPEVEERETWGEATFRVRDKIFVMGAPDGKVVSIKASLDDQAGLVAMDPSVFAVSAYTGRFGWVNVKLAKVRPDLLPQAADYDKSMRARVDGHHHAEPVGAK